MGRAFPTRETKFSPAVEPGRMRSRRATYARTRRSTRSYPAVSAVWGEHSRVRRSEGMPPWLVHTPWAFNGRRNAAQCPRGFLEGVGSTTPPRLRARRDVVL